MFKALITLVRGRTVTIAAEIADQNALVILDQQMRDASGALERAKRALAVAIAQDNQEGQRLDATRARIEDLETRAVAALEAGRNDLATEAAEASRPSRPNEMLQRPPARSSPPRSPS